MLPSFCCSGGVAVAVTVSDGADSDAAATCGAWCFKCTSWWSSEQINAVQDLHWIKNPAVVEHTAHFWSGPDIGARAGVSEQYKLMMHLTLKQKYTFFRRWLEQYRSFLSPFYCLSWPTTTHLPVVQFNTAVTQLSGSLSCSIQQTGTGRYHNVCVTVRVVRSCPRDSSKPHDGHVYI